ncbi:MULTISPECIES: tripartite tricarboxylate transporter TctB family protein [unclassified Pseudomonas]|uniref:tripartite tricarboxylate transporter TctB family protein n=1 Tax=unclassified Pseudomonas TaxID=196821 RepID=UPI00048464F4|nr:MULTISPECIES: tripartite tricarboxylate transporter TctB family protein [unclassified Pseudomonas]MBV7563799.1 tripartite tricarboxylate transporter TctB family protein [Pseudomonas sp. sia0905]PZW68748.1 tripartite tricarboxylate transporter TctB family protein [Pseudomonas sp. URMO17WK12:I1]
MGEITIRGSRPDLLASAIFIGLGALVLWSTRDLTVGSAAMMGPGYMPMMIGSLVIILGLVVGLIGLFKGSEPIGTVQLRPLLILLASVAGFALAAESAGFIIAAAGLIIFGSMADREWRGREVLISSTLLTLFGLVVFIYGLDVQMPVGPF